MGLGWAGRRVSAITLKTNQFLAACPSGNYRFGAGTGARTSRPDKVTQGLVAMPSNFLKYCQASGTSSASLGWWLATGSAIMFATALS